MNIKTYFTLHKTEVYLAVILGVLGILGLLGWQKFAGFQNKEIQEIDLAFDAEGPFALLFPRRDGNALILNLRRTSSYDEISYELAYTSQAEEVAMEGGQIKGQVLDTGESGGSGVIDRGVAGTIDTKDKKGEYEQEILFGTCSKNVCKYDKGVENGTLTLKIRKGNQAFRMVTQWHLQKPDVALGVLTSLDSHFTYKLDAEREELSATGFTIINDLSGIPKLPSAKIVLGKVYSLNVPIAKDLRSGSVTLELADNPPDDAKLYRYDQSESAWEELETKIEGSLVFSQGSGAGIFAVLIPK